MTRYLEKSIEGSLLLRSRHRMTALFRPSHESTEPYSVSFSEGHYYLNMILHTIRDVAFCHGTTAPSAVIAADVNQCSNSLIDSAFLDELRGDEILNGDAHRFVIRNLLFRFASDRSFGDKIGDLDDPIEVERSFL